jgi:hypothetical protein
MSRPIVRRPENWKFSHAAAAMGAYWARARRIEARRMARVPQHLRVGSGVVAAAPTGAASAAQQP